MLRACFPRFLRGRFFSVFFSVFSTFSSSVFFSVFLVFLCVFYFGRPSPGAVQLRSPGGWPESWNMGRWPPRPYRSKFIRRSVDYCNRFLNEARIVEYGGLREEGGGWENYTVFWSFSMRFLLPFFFLRFLGVFFLSPPFSTGENWITTSWQKMEKQCSERFLDEQYI